MLVSYIARFMDSCYTNVRKCVMGVGVDMNQKLTVVDSDQKERYCVISPQKDLREQLKEVFAIRSGYGFTVEVSEKEVRLVDYFAGETRASFTIVGLEDKSVKEEV